MAPALFLDRDGTLIVDKHYLADPAGVELLPGAAEGLRLARALGYRLFLFTNQSGVNRGYFTLEDVARVNDRMEQLLELPRPIFDDVCIAPEQPAEPSRYRKPSPAFIVETIARRGLDATRSWMIGDKMVDVDSGLNAGIGAVLLECGKVKPAEVLREARARGARVARDLHDFVRSLTEKAPNPAGRDQ